MGACEDPEDRRETEMDDVRPSALEGTGHLQLCFDHPTPKLTG